MKQILCLSYSPWQAHSNRTQQLLTRLTDAQILFFEPAPPKGSPRPEQGRRVRAHITAYTLPTALPAPREYPLLQKRKLDKASDFIQKTMRHHHFREPVLWATAPFHAWFLDKLAYRGAVYDCHRFWDEAYSGLESDLARHSEVVFAASNGLIRHLSPHNDNIALLPNGVNPLLFTQQDHPVPDAMKGLSGRAILGRAGAVTTKLDLEPLLYAARHRPEWTFVLMGRTSNQAIQELHGQDNIVLLGQVNPLDLPDYLCRCDLLFDLLHQNQLGSDVLPPVIYEYLAAGKPVVRVADPNVEDVLPQLIHTAYDGAGFVRSCREALSDAPADSARRRAFAQQSAWAGRAGQVAGILEATGLF